MATPIEFVDKQWEEWQENNPFDLIDDVDVDQLKNKIVEELSFTSKMDIREHTLYQKWLEIHEKYPLKEINTLWGNETILVKPEQESNVKSVKNNLWIPEDPDDYLNLKPKLVYSNGENMKNQNILKTFLSTGRNNCNIGRNLYYCVIDEITEKYIGVITISSDFLDLTPRDSYIGWSRDVKTQQGMINHTGIGSTIVPTQPLGFNYMGGKLLSLLCLSDTVQNDWRKNYGDILVGVTTTSLYGNTKSGGLSQYDGLEHWEKMGFSSGSVAYEPSRETMKLIFNWIKKNYPRKYFEWWEAKNENGLPLKRDHKNRSLNFAYSKLGIPKELIRTEHQRGIYFSPLYNNTGEFLRKEIVETDLVKSFDTSEEALTNIWKTKYAKGRISMLKKKNNVSKESLFYDDLIFMSWEETKEKYLGQVGR